MSVWDEAEQELTVPSIWAEAEQENAGGGLEELGKGLISSTIGVAKHLVIQGLEEAIKAPGEYLAFVLPEYEKAAPKEQREKLVQPLVTAKRRMTIAQAKFKKTHTGVAAWAGRILGEALPYMATAMAGGLLAGPMGAALVGFSVEGGQAYEDAIKSGATEEQAQLERGIVGSINAAIEAVQIGRLIKFQEAGRHSIKALGRLAKQKLYGKIIKEGAKFIGRLLKHSVEEGIEEFLQEGVAFAVPANLRDDMPRRPDGSPDLWAIGQRLGGAFAGGAWAGGILGGAGSVSIDMDIRQKITDLTKNLTPDQRNEIISGKADQAVEDDPTMTSEEKYSAKFILGNIRYNIEEELVSRLNTNDIEVKDSQSMTLVLNDIAKALGLDIRFVGKLTTRKTKRLRGSVTRNPLPDGSYRITTHSGHWSFFTADRQMELRRHFIHEIGHRASPPYYKGSKRMAHHAEFKKWYNDNVGILIPEIKKTLGPVMEAHLEQEAEQLGELGLTEEQVTDKFVKEFDEGTEAIKEAQAMPNKRSRKKLLALGHKIPTQFGLSDDERRNWIEDMTGKRSLRDLNTPELEALITVMEEVMGATELTPEDFQKPIQVAGETTTAAAIMKGAAEDVQALPERKVIPKHVTKKFARSRERTRWKRLKEFLWGKENTPIYHLANMLGPTFTDVFDKNIQQSLVTQAGHLRSVYHALLQARTEQGITDADLARMSHALNPRMQTLQTLQEAYGRGTEIHTVEINGREYDVTTADLLDIYLISGQEDGIRHLLGGGLVINGVETGALDEDTISELNQMVESDSQAKFMADAILEIGEDIWKNSINNVSQRMEGKDIAIVENWWGLEVYHPKRLGGKQEQFNMNLIENRSIFKDRTKSAMPLVVRDAFSRFAVFENGIAEYVGFAESTRLARTVLNSPDLSNTLDQKGYGDIREKILTIMERAQSLPKQQGAFGKFMAEQLPGLYRAYLYFNPRVIMSQYTSVMNYGALVSPKYMTHVKDGLSNQAIQETLELSDIAFDRFYMAHSNLALGEAAKSDSVLRMFTHKAADINKAGITLRMADMGALAAGMKIAQAELKDAQANELDGESAIWWADKNIGAEEGSLDWKNAVTKRAEFLWQRSQPSWDKWNRSMTTSGLVRQVFFPFRTFHEKSLTILHEANLEYQRSNKGPGDRARQAKKYGAVLSGYTLNMILRALLMALLTRRLKKPLQYLSDLFEAPLSMFPIIGTTLKNSIGNFVNVLIDEKVEFHGEAIEAFPATMLNLIAQAPADFSIAAGYYLDGDTEKANRAFKRALQKTYKGIGTTEGIPVSEMDRVYKGWIEGAEEPKQRGRRSRRVRPRKVRARRVRSRG
jgi:hypothetical protein